MGSIKQFTKKYEYDQHMDKEVVDLCDAMNALPGIKTIDSCCGHDETPFGIFFRVSSEEGLFFLTRCVNRRYWKYGGLWKIELSVGDRYESGNLLPVIYHLHSGIIVGEDAYNQAKDLIKNMNAHLNVWAFLKGYDLDLDDFELE